MKIDKKLVGEATKRTRWGRQNPTPDATQMTHLQTRPRLSDFNPLLPAEEKLLKCSQLGDDCILESDLSARRQELSNFLQSNKKGEEIFSDCFYKLLAEDRNAPILSTIPPTILKFVLDEVAAVRDELKKVRTGRRPRTKNLTSPTASVNS